MHTYKNWRLETDNDQILWLYFDKQNSTINTLDRAVMDELSHILDSLHSNLEFKGLILLSGKESGFIAGADIAQFSQLKGIDEATQLLRHGQMIFDKLEALKIPTVAMIQGFCLGGGLELALSCRYRIAEDNTKTKIGLPEVKLGIHPGWGGSVRLPRLIGAVEGLNLILSGHTVNAKKAAKLGLIDAAVPARHLLRAAVYYAGGQTKPHQATRWQALTNQKPIRSILAMMMRKKLKAKVNPIHYPAPFHVLDNWEQFGVVGKLPMDREARSCGKLFFSESCQNLVRVFFLQNTLKNLVKAKQYTFKHVHVIGAGLMGGDIAAWCALRGFHVTLQDREPQFIAPAIKRAYELFKDKLKEPYLIQKAMDRLIPDVDGNGVSTADLIIEAIYEDLSAKQVLFKSIEDQIKSQAILATNTSSIPLDDIAAILKTPEKLVGIHFFNPVAKMQLVEVVKGKRTDATAVEKAISFVHQIDHLPLPVKSSPGFLVNRILMPYLLESVKLLDQGIPASAIDKAMTDFGMPMGPITLADSVGLDICLSVANHLGQYFTSPIPQRLIDLVAKGNLGKKSGEGFYQYKNDQKIVQGTTEYDNPLETISDPLIARMLQECFACLEEGIVSDSDLLDAGMIFGTGFAPFRGGPIRYARSHCAPKLAEHFVSLAK